LLNKTFFVILFKNTLLTFENHKAKRTLRQERFDIN
jgi:hypothetical protein